MFENLHTHKIKGKCPCCGSIVSEFSAVYVCLKCKRVWSKGLKEWGTCDNCIFADEGTCNHCAGDNFGHATEIAGNARCENYKERK